MFKLGDVVIDRIQYAWAEPFAGDKILYTLSQLADATIDISAESKDATDAQGTLIKKFWQGKTGTFSANNAMLNLNILAAQSGIDAEMATAENAIYMPKFLTVPATQKTVTLTGYDAAKANLVVTGVANNGSKGADYTSGQYSVTSGGVLTLPDGTDEDQFAIRYMRKCQDGAMISNSADKFPSTVRLYLKCLGVDPCSADTLKALVVELPSFQPSPETSIALETESQLEFSGVISIRRRSAYTEMCA